MVGHLINSRYFLNSLGGVTLFSFSLLYKASEGNYILFLEKVLKCSKALQHFLSQNTQKSIATSERISGGFLESLGGLGSALP